VGRGRVPKGGNDGSGGQRGCIDVAVWGALPPPYGGKTVHIARLIPALLSAGFTVRVYDLVARGRSDPMVQHFGRRPLRWFLHLMGPQTPRCHYVVGEHPLTLLLATLTKLVRRRKVILCGGGASLERNAIKRSALVRWVTRLAVRHADAYIGASARICALARQLGARPDRVHLIPAFIPPSGEGGIPRDVRQFLSSHAPRLIMTGQVGPDPADTYGARAALDYLQRACAVHPNAGLIFAVSSLSQQSDQDVALYRKAVEQGGLGGHLFVVARQGELWPLTQQCDLFLRPTTSDGDAVSVREALSLGVPVVASDCVPRPPGAVTYRTGDVADLFNKVEQVLAAMSSYRRRIRQIDQGNASGPTVALVSRLLGTTPEDAVLRPVENVPGPATWGTP